MLLLRVHLRVGLPYAARARNAVLVTHLLAARAHARVVPTEGLLATPVSAPATQP